MIERGIRALGLVVAVTSASLGCGNPGAPPVEAPELVEGCEVLDPGECLLPWPSGFYLQGEGDAARVEIPAHAMPVNGRGTPVDPAPWNGWDGFSAMTSMVARVEGAVSRDGLASWRDVEASLDAGSPTVVYDVDAGARIAHFVDVLPQLDDAEHTTIVLRPAARMPEGHRIVVALRDLRQPDGTPVAPSATFAALRDGEPTEWPLLEARRESFERDVLEPLATAGITRSELVLAWSFRTASNEHASRDLRSMVERARTVDVETLGCEVATAEPAEALGGRSVRRIVGTFEVPAFLDDTTQRLRRDAEGLPVAEGTRLAAFHAVVPASIESAEPGSVPVLLFGHGLFNQAGELSEATGGGAEDLAYDGQMIALAADVEGLDGNSAGATGGALLELSQFPSVVDRVLQSLVATVLLPRVFAASCSALPEVDVEGVVDPSRVRWYGDSQGGILGITVAALSPDVERAVLGVGGISYPIMIPRSVDFAIVGNLLASAYRPAARRELLMAMFANHFDRFEGATFAPELAARIATPEGPQLLFQVGVHDVGTPEVSGEIAARTLGLPVLEGSATGPSGLAPAGTAPRSAYVSYAFAGVDAPADEQMPVENCVHESVRRDPAARAQALELLVDGTITNHCEGDCADRGLYAYLSECE